MKSFSPEAWLLPQYVLVIGTYDPSGKPNAMTAGWSIQQSPKEIMISFGSHATTDNLKNCPEFTVAYATPQTIAAADYVGSVSGRTTPDKVAKTGWNIEHARHVNAPVFTDFPMTLECRIKEIKDETEAVCNIVAEIVNILVDENYLTPDGMPDVRKMQLITFDPVLKAYIESGRCLGEAFSLGTRLI